MKTYGLGSSHHAVFARDKVEDGVPKRAERNCLLASRTIGKLPYSHRMLATDIDFRERMTYLTNEAPMANGPTCWAELFKRAGKATSTLRRV